MTNNKQMRKERKRYSNIGFRCLSTGKQKRR